VRSKAIQNATHLHNRAGELHLLTENFRAIRRRKNGSANIQPDLAPVDVKGGHDFDVAWAIAANLPVHQPHASAIAR